MEQSRKRGGQRGNRNALKQGYYSKIFTEKTAKADFCSAGNIEGIDEEIALIRHVIKTVAQSQDDKSFSILVRATNALNRLVRTRQKLYGKQNTLEQAMNNVVKDILVPLGLDIGPDFFTKNRPNHETNSVQNESE